MEVIYIDPTHINLHTKPNILMMFDICHFHLDEPLMNERGDPSKDMTGMMFPIVWCVV